MNFLKKFKTINGNLEAIRLSDNKDEVFDKWTSIGIKHPYYELYEDEMQIERFNEKFERWLLRLNNSHSGLSTCVCHAGIDANIMLNRLRREIELDKKNNRMSKIMLVEKILPSPDLILGRSYVVYDEILNSHTYWSSLENIDSLVGRYEDFDEFIEANRKVLVQSKKYEKDITSSVRSLGLDIGCVDYLLHGDEISFLEVNSYWGFGNSDVGWPHMKVFIAKLDEERYKYEKETPNVYARMDERMFWHEFYRRIIQ